MYSRIWTVLVVAMALLVAGCGGGGGEQQGGRQEGQQNGQGGGGGQGPETFRGRVVQFDAESNELTAEGGGEEPMVFRVNPEQTRIRLDGEEASPGDIEQGQRTTVRFTAGGEGRPNIARSVVLRAGDGERTGGGAGGETTGG